MQQDSKFKLYDKISVWLSLIIAMIAMLTSCQTQRYVEANYENSQKIILINESFDTNGVTKLKPVAESQAILSVDVIYPKELTSHRDIILSDGKYDPAVLNAELIKSLPKVKNEHFDPAPFVISVPVKLSTRYATYGDAYSDISLYDLNVKISPVKDKSGYISFRVLRTEFVYLARKDRNILSIACEYFGYGDEKYDIDKMYKSGSRWAEIKFVGRI